MLCFDTKTDNYFAQVVSVIEVVAVVVEDLVIEVGEVAVEVDLAIEAVVVAAHRGVGNLA